MNTTKQIATVKLSPAFKRQLFTHIDKGVSVFVPGFGIFSVKAMPRKKIYHNFSKRTRVLAGYNKLKFTQSPELKKRLTKKHD